jgi:hyaluronan synthase
MQPLQYLIYFYIFLNVIHLISQHSLAIIYHAHNKQLTPTQIKDLISKIPLARKQPYISIIFPIFNEEKHILNTVFHTASIAIKQDNNLEIIFVNDGSDNKGEIIEIYQKYFKHRKRVRLIHQDNKGKREAQITGLHNSVGKIIVTVDSDTLISNKDIYLLVSDIVTNTQIGSTTGNVYVTNREENLLTELTSQRYWMANNVERASQSIAGAVLCNCGAFACYRRDILEDCQFDYLNQKFLGNICTYGDDRHLTNLTLSKGWKTSYSTFATAYTIVPNQMSKFINQQTRWSKSFFREMLWTIKFAKTINWYSVWSMVANPVLSLLLLISLANIVLISTLNPVNLVKYLGVICLMAWGRALLPLIILRDWKFVLFPMYSVLHFFILLPLKIKALVNINDGKWATRDLVNFKLTKKWKRVGIYFNTMIYWLFLVAVVVAIYWFGFKK